MNLIFAGKTYGDADIKSRANAYEVMSPLSDALEYDVFNFSVRSGMLGEQRLWTRSHRYIVTASNEIFIIDDGDITALKFGEPVRIYDGDELKETFYVKAITPEDIIDGKDEFFRVECVSLIGLLAKRPHYGDVYVSERAGDIIDDILGTLPHSVDNDVASVLVSGWLPIVSDARQNLLQVLFATGASVFKTPTGIRIGFNRVNGSAVIVPKERTFRSGLYKKKEQASRIAVTEHEFLASNSTDEQIIAETSDDKPRFIRFSQPYHSLRASGVTITSSGANWAQITGVGTLYGKPYIHTMREITGNVDAAGEAGEGITISFTDKTLVSLLNAEYVLGRLVNYYSNAIIRRVQFAVENEKPGDYIGFYNRRNERLSGFVRSIDKTLTSFWRGTADVITDWTPSNLGNVYNAVAIITESGTWTPPEDYAAGTSAYVVIIGGATGGLAGEDGQPGGVDINGHIEGSFEYHDLGEGGKGGAGGAGGTGVMVRQVEYSQLSGSYAVAIGTGGLEGAIGMPTTFGSDSSEDGELNTEGLINLITGVYYCLPGGNGIAGADGGDGGSLSGYVSMANPYFLPNAGSPGGSVGTALGGNPGTKLPAPSNALIYRQNTGAAGGGGGAASNVNGGDGNETEFMVGGSGGAGASALPLSQAANGQCGRGGDGGGGGGGAGAKVIRRSDPRGGVGRAGAAGTGSAGQQGGNGLVIVYYQTGSGATASPQISVIAPRLSTITVSDGQTYTLTGNETSHVFEVSYGNYTVTATRNTDTASATVIVDSLIPIPVSLTYHDYVYDYGDKKQGWSIVNFYGGNQSVLTAKFTTDAMRIEKASGTSSTYRKKGFGSGLIDTTGKTKLCFRFLENASTSGLTGKVALVTSHADSSNSADLTNAVTSFTLPTSVVGGRTYELNISAYSGQYRVAFYLAYSTTNAVRTVSLSEMWLE